MAVQPILHIDPDILRTLHRILRQRSDLQSQLRRCPMQIQAGQAAVDAARTRRDEAKESIKRSKISADQKQLQLRSREARLEDTKVKLNQAANNKEFQLLKDQIAADLQANSVAADEILEILEQIDVLNIDLGARELELKEAEAKLAKLAADIQQRVKVCEGDLLGVEAELSSVETELPEEFKVEYRRVITTRGEDALACVEASTCEGCYQTLTTHLMDRLALKQLISCPNCGAMLYLPENRRL